MCDICERILANVPENIITAFQSLTVEAEAFGTKAADVLIEAGFLAMEESSFSDEDRLSGKDKRIKALYGLVAIAGFTTNYAFHEQHLVADIDSIFSTTSDLGWATGHGAQNQVVN